MQDMRFDTRHGVLSLLRRLSDGELVARLKSLVARERRATALLVAHLGELDTRDVHLRAGFSSLFAYCRDALALSEHEAYNRIEVARAARRFPVILELLAAGSVNLTTVRLLAPHLTPENHRSVLESARGKKKVEVEEIVAGLSPRPEVTAFIRKLAGPKPASPLVEAPAPLAPFPAPSARHLLGQAGSGEVTPLSPDRYKLQVTIGGATLEKLRLAKDMLRHAIPSGDDGHPRSGPDGAAHGSGSEQVRRHGETPRASYATTRIAPHPGGGQAYGLGARPRALRIPRYERPPLRRARCRGVPPRSAVRGRRRGECREHRAAMPPSQRLRDEGGLVLERVRSSGAIARQGRGYDACGSTRTRTFATVPSSTWGGMTRPGGRPSALASAGS